MHATPLKLCSNFLSSVSLNYRPSKHSLKLEKKVGIPKSMHIMEESKRSRMVSLLT